MNYKVQRNGEEYGPYTLADLQRYVASGNILLSDLVRSEGMDEWVPVSQVIGNIPVPPAPVPQVVTPLAPSYPAPPALHWGILLALDILTCGLFGYAWVIVQAVWVRKVEPESKGLYYVIGGVALFLIAGSYAFKRESSGTAGLINLVGVVLWLVGVFSMKASIEQHYNTAEPIYLRLSGVMTFFFNVIYFQYHFTEINRVKKAQQLSMGQHA